MDNIKQICELEFPVFSNAIKKMGFDPQGFTFMILLYKKSLTREKLLDKFDLTEEEKVAVENRIKLFS